MSDIVERLVDPRYCGQEGMRSEAAETILALRKEAETMRGIIRGGLDAARASSPGFRIRILNEAMSAALATEAE